MCGQRRARRRQALQDAGCFAVVLECLPAVVAAAATSQLDIPTIGIGAGPHCSGQARRPGPARQPVCFLESRGSLWAQGGLQMGGIDEFPRP
jgi:hypothetical protein